MEPLSHALQCCKMLMTKILKQCEASTYELYIGASGSKNFRYKIAKTAGVKGFGYKAGRPAKPIYYQAVRDYLVSKWNAQSVYIIETDDMLAIRQTECYISNIDSIIATLDKDLLQVPGKFYNWRKNTFQTISELEGWRNLYKQVLMGDSSDNIPGIKGIGPVTALKVLKKCKDRDELYTQVVNVYMTKLLNTKDYVTQEDVFKRLEEVYTLVYLLRDRQELERYV